MCASAHMNSSGMPAHPHKYDINDSGCFGRKLPAKAAVDVVRVTKRYGSGRIFETCEARSWDGPAHTLFGPSAVAAMLIFYALKIVSLRTIPTGSSDHDIIEHHAIRRTAQLVEEFRPSKSSGDASQPVQLRTLIFF